MRGVVPDFPTEVHMLENSIKVLNEERGPWLRRGHPKFFVSGLLDIGPAASLGTRRREVLPGWGLPVVFLRSSAGS